jgi:small-conductance mechanosensitive channel
MSSDVHELIRVSNDTARRILSRELRKAIGLYYLLWGTYPMVIATFYAAAFEFSEVYYCLIKFNVFSIPMIYIITMAIAIVYVFLTYRFYITAHRVYRSPIITNRRRRSGLTWTVIYTVAIIVYLIVIYLIVIASLTKSNNDYDNIIAYMLTLAFAVFVVLNNAYLFKSSVVKARYYDYLANASFLILFPLSFMYYFGDYILSLIWIYAGARSLLEVISGG